MRAGLTNESTRISWLEKTLQKIPNNSKILDAGAGEQQFKKFCSHLKYTAQDFGQYDGIGDSSALQTGSWEQNNLDIISDITDIPVPNQSFDAIMCTEVLEHLPFPISALKEFARILKPNGQLIITAPFCSLSHFTPFHFSSGFNKYWYEKHLQDHGFEIIELLANGNFFDYLAQELHRLHHITKQYTDIKLSKLDKMAINRLLKTLDNATQRDKGSNELLCFGYHVLAQKI